jgi:tRNA dimethylallyltransferase
VKPRLLAIVGPTATGKSALAIAIAERVGGEVVSCDSTAVYRGFDIGTDKVPAAQQRGIPHHLVDVVEPTEEYYAARYAREAAAVIRAITSRGRLPILAGGTGFYYRALTRGLFEGPSRHDELRRRLERVASVKGPERLHRWLARVDAPSAARIAANDVKRVVRALEVWILT